MEPETKSIPVDPQWVYRLRIEMLASEVVRRKQEQGLIKKSQVARDKAFMDAFNTLAILAGEMGLGLICGFTWNAEKGGLLNPGMFKEKVEAPEAAIKVAGEALADVELLTTQIDEQGEAGQFEDSQDSKRALAANYLEMARMVRTNPEAMALVYERMAEGWAKAIAAEEAAE